MLVTLKFFLVIVIIISSAYLGFLKSISYVKREKSLRDICIFFNRIKSEILYTQNTLPNVYESSRQDLEEDIKNMLGAISTDMLICKDKFSIEKSIEKNVDSIKCLEEIDKNYIKKGLKNLGKTDLEGQENLIKNTLSLLEVQLKDATKMKEKNAKLYKKLGVVIGLFIVIIVI